MTAVIQRPLRGSRISTFYPVKNLPSLASLDSAFQLQEYISLLIRLNVHDVNAIVSLPGHPSAGKEKEKEGEGSPEKKGKEGEKDGDVEKGKGEPTVDEACWIYEQLRRLAQDLSHPLITTLQQECTRASCPEMKAGEWLYLCVAHGNDGAMEHCCAIDYILHTVDSATALLNSPRTFPSRLQIPAASHRHFSSLARRLGRIFAHAYFHHREAFEQAEAESSLYARFLALTERFDLVPAEFLVIPMDGSSSGESMGLGHPPRAGREDHRRPNEFDRGYHQQQQQRTRYDLDLGKFHHGGSESSVQHSLHPSLEERDPSPPGPSSPESSSGGIGESPSPSAKSRSGRLRTGTMVFAEAEAAAVTDELAVRTSIREREREPQKIELLERFGDPLAVKTAAVPVVSTHEDDESRFEISLSPEEVIEGGGSGVAPEIFEESSEPVEKHEATSVLDSKPELEVAGTAVEPPSVPAEPEASVSAEPTESSKSEVAPTPTPAIVAEEPKEEPAVSVVSVEPAASTEIKSDEPPPIPTEATTDIPPADENVSIPEAPEPEPTIEPTPNQEAETKLEVADDKETVHPPVVDEAPPLPPTAVPAVVEAVAPSVVEPEVESKPEPKTEEEVHSSNEQVPADKTQHEAVVEAAEPVVVEPIPEVATKEEEKPSVVDSTDIPEEKKT